MTIRNMFDPLIRYFSRAESSSPTTPKSSASTPTSANQRDPLLDSLPSLTTDFELSKNSVELKRPLATSQPQYLDLKEQMIQNTFRSILIRSNGMDAGLSLSMEGHFAKGFWLESIKEPSGSKNVEFLLHRSTVVKSSQVYARPALKKGKRGWKSYIHSTPQKQTKERNEIGSGTIELFIEAAKAKVAPKIHRILKTEGSADGKYQDDYFTKYANCGDLLNFLEANQNLCSELALELGEKLIQKVALLHSLGIAHRDIKPDNILVHENEENKEIEVYLCDFGFATKDSFSSQMPGSRNYFPPEYKQNDFGRREVPNIPQGPKIGIPTHSPFLVDCYTLGLTLFILLTKDSYEENLITHLKIHSEKLETLYQQCANLQDFIALEQKISDQVIDENLSDWPENVLTVIKGLVRHLPSERITPAQALELWKEANGSSGKLPLVDPEEISLELD